MIVDCAAYRKGHRCGGTLSVGEARRWLQDEPDSFVWLGLRVPSDGELDELRSCFDRDGADFDGIDLHEAVSPHQRPVLTTTGGATWLVLRTAHYNDQLERVYLGELSVIVGERFIATIRHGQASPLRGVRQALEADPTRLALGPLAVLAAIAEQVVDDYGPALDGFERDALEVEAEVFDGSRRHPVQRLYLLKRQLRELLVVVDGLQEPLRRLIQPNRLAQANGYRSLKGPEAADELRNQFQETLDQLSRVVQRARSLADLLTSALDANLTQVSLQQNEDMRRISAWVAIAVVPTMIAGVYGMNFDNLPELHWRYGYPAVLAFMAVACGLLYRAFRRSGWL